MLNQRITSRFLAAVALLFAASISLAESPSAPFECEDTTHNVTSCDTIEEMDWDEVEELCRDLSGYLTNCVYDGSICQQEHNPDRINCQFHSNS